MDINQSLIIPNELGDVGITWDSSNDLKMIALIDKKMKEGMTFYIIKTNFIGLKSKQKVDNIIDAMKNRQIFVKDQDFNDIMGTQGIETFKRASSTIDTYKKVEKAEEIIGHHTVGIAQRKGG